MPITISISSNGVCLNDSQCQKHAYRDKKGKSLIQFPSEFVVIDLETTGLSPEYDDKGALVINIIEHGTENNEYAVLLGEADNDELRKVYEPLQNKEWYLGASYMGFSNVLKLPSVTAWFVACDNEFYDESFDNLISMGMQAEASDYISLSEFNSIEIGMSLKEVQTIVGKSGKLSAESENAFIYEWKGEHGDGVALIHFSDGVVISKSESGLK